MVVGSNPTAGAQADILTIINDHPSWSIVQLEVMNEGFIGTRDLIAHGEGVIAPGESALLPIDTSEGGCEYALIATFENEDETQIQARGVDVCQDPVWTLLDGDYRID